MSGITAGENTVMSILDIRNKKLFTGTDTIDLNAALVDKVGLNTSIGLKELARRLAITIKAGT